MREESLAAIGITLIVLLLLESLRKVREDKAEEKAREGNCDRTSCWCYRPNERWIPSMGITYDVLALPFVGEPWLFQYVYIEANL